MAKAEKIVDITPNYEALKRFLYSQIVAESKAQRAEVVKGFLDYYAELVLFTKSA